MTVVAISPPSLCVPLVTCGGVSPLANSLAHAAAGAVLDAITSSLTSAAAWLVRHVVQLVTGPGQVNLLEPWFAARSKVMVQLLELVVVPMLMIATIGPVLRQDLRRLARVWGVGLPVAVLVGLSGAQFTQLAIGATDALCQAIIGDAKASLGGPLGGLATALITPGTPQLVAAVISVLLIIGSVLLWMELVVRSAAIYVAVFFMPLALACYVWPATMVIARRTIELLAALILSKFVIVATLTLGVAAIRGAPSEDNAVVGSAILLLAGFAPFCLLRLAPVVEAGAIAHLEGVSRRPWRVAGRAATTVAAGPAHPVVGLVMSAGSGGSSPPNPASVLAQPIPARRADYASDPPAGGSDG